MRCSVVVPLYNEAENLTTLHRRLVSVFESMECERELIFVNDGSTDASSRVLLSLARADKTVRVVTLSRNFGHEAASTAGLDRASGDIVVLMDADLQDPPELIPEMVKKWRAGNQVVFARRRKRIGESQTKILLSSVFYRLINRIIDFKLPVDVGDFRLMDEKVVQALRECREQNRFVRALVSWVGFKQIGIEYDRDARYAGTTKYNLAKLILLTADVVSGFSIVPLRAVIVLGFITTLGSFTISSIVILQRLQRQLKIPGYALMTAGLFMLAGVQLIVLGVLGEYIGKIYRHAQGRPLYIVQDDFQTGVSSIKDT